MTHLSPAEFVDLADGTLAPLRARHAAQCEDCRRQATLIGDALQLASISTDVPEPSPMFWDHFSARVRESVAAEPTQRVGLIWRFLNAPRGLQPGIAVLLVAVAIFAAALLPRGHRNQVVLAPTTATVAPATGDPDQERETTLDSNHAEVWSVLTAAAADLKYDEATAVGMAVQPAAIDQAVQRLTSAELTELGRILQTELKGSGN